eukprot:3120715-Rhodomonas_salina.1
MAVLRKDGSQQYLTYWIPDASLSRKEPHSESLTQAARGFKFFRRINRNFETPLNTARAKAPYPTS